MGIVIKKMESNSEIKGKGYVHWKSWHEAYSEIISQEYLDKLTLEKCVNMAYKWHDNILVALNGDKVVGFVGYGKYRDDALEDAGEIFALYILPEYYYQKKGYALMRAALEQISQYKQVA